MLNKLGFRKTSQNLNCHKMLLWQSSLSRQNRCIKPNASTKEPMIFWVNDFWHQKPRTKKISRVWLQHMHTNLWSHPIIFSTSPRQVAFQKTKKQNELLRMLNGLPYQEGLLLVHCCSRVQTAVGGNRHTCTQGIPCRSFYFRNERGGEIN
jgi:hypothetical protein